MRTDTESKKVGGHLICPERHTGCAHYRGRVPSRKYGRTAADALPKPRCGMRCPDEPQLEQGDGHEQDGDTSDIASALYQQVGLRGPTRRELCRHLRHPLRENLPESCLPNVKVLYSFRG